MIYLNVMQIFLLIVLTQTLSIGDIHSSFLPGEKTREKVTYSYTGKKNDIFSNIKFKNSDLQIENFKKSEGNSVWFPVKKRKRFLETPFEVPNQNRNIFSASIVKQIMKLLDDPKNTSNKLRAKKVKMAKRETITNQNLVKHDYKPFHLGNKTKYFRNLKKTIKSVPLPSKIVTKQKITRVPNEALRELQSILEIDEGHPKIIRRSVAKEISNEIPDASDKELTENTDFSHWLSDEYYKNLARTWASMRRKRSEAIPTVETIDENEFENLDEATGQEITERFGDPTIQDVNFDKGIYEKNILDFDSAENEETNDDYYLFGDKEDDTDITPGVLDDAISKGRDREIDRKRKRRELPFRKVNEDSNRVDLDLGSLQNDLIYEALQMMTNGNQRSKSDEIRNRLKAAEKLDNVRRTINDLYTRMDKLEYKTNLNN